MYSFMYVFIHLFRKIFQYLISSEHIRFSKEFVWFWIAYE